jgi:hypothetical protein
MNGAAFDALDTANARIWKGEWQTSRRRLHLKKGKELPLYGRAAGSGYDARPWAQTMTFQTDNTPTLAAAALAAATGARADQRRASDQIAGGTKIDTGTVIRRTENTLPLMIVGAHIAHECGDRNIYWHRDGFADWKTKGYQHLNPRLAR